MKKGLNISTFSNIQKAVAEEEPKKEEKKTMMSYILERGFLSKSEQEDLRDLIQNIRYHCLFLFFLWLFFRNSFLNIRESANI